MPSFYIRALALIDDFQIFCHVNGGKVIEISVNIRELGILKVEFLIICVSYVDNVYL